MFFDTFTKLFGFDSDPQLDTGKLAKIKDVWQIDIVSDPNNPLQSAKEKGVEIIEEEMNHGHKWGGAWRSSTKGRG